MYTITHPIFSLQNIVSMPSQCLLPFFTSFYMKMIWAHLPVLCALHARGANLHVCRWIFARGMAQTVLQIFLLPSYWSHWSFPAIISLPHQRYSYQDLANKVPSWLLERDLPNNRPMLWSPQISHLNNHSPPPRSTLYFSHRIQDSHYCNDAPHHVLLKWKSTNRWSRGPLGKSILISMGNICLCALAVCRDLTAKFNIKG